MENNIENTRLSYKDFVHCPFPDCDEPIKGSWRDLDTGKKNKEGLPIYRCPNGHSFTANDLKVNAVPVKNIEYDTYFVNINNGKIVFYVPESGIFTDGIEYYIHCPLLIVADKNVICIQLPKDTESPEIVVKNYIKTRK